MGTLLDDIEKLLLTVAEISATKATEEMKERLRVSCTNNSQIKGSWGVVDRVNLLLKST